MSTHDHKDVLEVGADVFGGERERPGLLEHDGDDVVSNVTLPQQLEEFGKCHSISDFTVIPYRRQF